MAIYFTRMRKTHRISPNLVQIKYDLLFHITGPILQDTSTLLLSNSEFPATNQAPTSTSPNSKPTLTTSSSSPTSPST